MTIHWIIIALWFVFIVYWAISAIGVKHRAGALRWRTGIAVRLGVFVLLVFALRESSVRDSLRNVQAYFDGNVLIGIIGVLLCVFGMGLAVYARIYLGRNWGMPMTRKINPELVTTGPYAYIRHPIYTGFLFATLGSALAESVFWVIVVILFGLYFVYSARREEQIMLAQFPHSYPAYKMRTKMLLPFVL